MGQEYGLETLPVDSPWKDKIENWKYPSGKSAYTDEKQDPNEILQIMRDSAQERIDARKTDEEEETEQPVSDEEFDKAVDEILNEGDESEEEEEDEDEVDEEDEEVEEETEDDEESEDESETEESEPEEEQPEEEEESFDPEEIAEQIAALRAEIEELNFVPEESPDDESE